MPTNTNTTSVALIGVIVIAFTLAVYFLLGIEMSGTNGYALAFLLLAELILFGGLIGVQFSGQNHSKVFLVSGFTGALLLYFFVTLILTFLAGWLKESEKLFILLELGALVLFAITAISLFSVSRGIAQRNEEDAAKIGSTEAKRGGF